MWGQLAFVFVFKRHYCNPVKRILTLENVYQLKTSHCKAKALCMPACVIFSCRTEHPLLLQPCNYRPFSPSQTRHHLLEPSHHHQRAPWCSPPMLQSFLIIHYRVHHLTRDYDYVFFFIPTCKKKKRGGDPCTDMMVRGGENMAVFIAQYDWLNLLVFLILQSRLAHRRRIAPQCCMNL